MSHFSRTEAMQATPCGYRGNNTVRSWRAVNGVMTPFEPGVIDVRTHLWELFRDSKKVAVVLGSDEHSYPPTFRSSRARRQWACRVWTISTMTQVNDGKISPNPKFTLPEDYGLWSAADGAPVLHAGADAMERGSTKNSRRRIIISYSQPMRKGSVWNECKRTASARINHKPARCEEEIMNPMKQFLIILCLFAAIIGCRAQERFDVAEHSKREYQIPMRNSVKLLACVYTTGHARIPFCSIARRTALRPTERTSQPARAVADSVDEGRIHLRLSGCARKDDERRRVRNYFVPSR